jgi:hypothetical protein
MHNSTIDLTEGVEAGINVEVLLIMIRKVQLYSLRYMKI